MSWVLAAVAPSRATLPEFSHYQVVIDRKPFGEIAGASNAVLTNISESSFARDLELRAIVDENGAVRVGLLDKRSNRSFYIGLNETIEGLQLISADYDAEEVVLRKGEETVVLKLHPDQQGASPAPVTAAQPPPAATPTPFQGLAPAFPTNRPSASRRPFFADLKRRRTMPTPESNAPPAGFPGFFQPSASATNPPAPFGPFTPVSGTNAPVNFPFGVPATGAPPVGVAQPFIPFNPPPAAAPAEGRGATIEELLQQQSGADGQPFQPAEFNPFQPVK